ncbi:uncharacterized protein LOC142344979 [Convolutriloba macropyga]|uniref:uncharacterized protein LOC142344979 n=1 Tax=Convolutriloba macropyga TaxID=536237 RepID=UPI003F5207E5
MLAILMSHRMDLTTMEVMLILKRSRLKTSTSGTLLDFFENDMGRVQDPEAMLDWLANRYRMKKKMFRKAADCYFALNTYLFIFPVLLLTALATVLTHVDAVEEATHGRRMITQEHAHATRHFIIGSLEAICVLWQTTQMQIGWVSKTGLAKSAMLNYSSILLLVDHFRLLISVQRNKGMS